MEIRSALMASFYEAFERGEKTRELQLYRPRWNEKTCPPGRSFILSKGYGKQNRLQGIITLFYKRDATTYQSSILRLSGTLEKSVAEIRIRVVRESGE